MSDIYFGDSLLVIDGFYWVCTCWLLFLFQCCTDQIIFKLFGKDPSDLPHVLRAQVVLLSCNFILGFQLVALREFLASLLSVFKPSKVALTEK